MIHPDTHGYGRALGDLGAELAELADQAQREINAAIQQAQTARNAGDTDAEIKAARAIADALRRKLGWMAALQVCLAAERRHLTTQISDKHPSQRTST